MQTLIPIAERIAHRLTATNQKLAVAESSAGGLISAALLAIPGASAYFVAGGVVYTPKARFALMGLTREDVAGLRGATEPYAQLLAQTCLSRFGVDWALAETGATGPSGNPYGDPPGHACFAVAGPGVTAARSMRTGQSDRLANMQAFAAEALVFLERQLITPSPFSSSDAS